MTDEQRLQMITEQLILVRDNLFRGMSKSIQKLQARSINEVLELPNHTQSPPEQQEPVAWKNAAIRLGEELSSVGPDGYYDMTAEQWLDWAMDQRPHGKNSLPAQRTWVSLTDEELSEVYNQADWDTVNGWEYERAIEAKLRSKNEDRN
jgi:hypothetical protein